MRTRATVGLNKTTCVALVLIVARIATVIETYLLREHDEH